MGSEYRPDRRIDAIKPLSSVSRSDATEATDLRREKASEAERERLSAELGKAPPRRSFADLLRKKP